MHMKFMTRKCSAYRPVLMKKFVSTFLVLMLLCSSAFAETTRTDMPATTSKVITIDTSNTPSIPAGTMSASIVSFTGNQTYAVFSAPDSKSIRGAKGRARVSTNGWIQVFGAEGDWILVQYDITKDHNRIGYIYKNALPKDVTVPDLVLTDVDAVINYDVEATDDPLVSKAAIAKLTENTKVKCLGAMGDWTYIESSEKGVRFRGFVPTECLSGMVTDMREAKHALVGSWKLYAGSSFNASKITFREDGSMTGTTQLESGREMEWSGSWSIEEYDTSRDRYWNESEFELTMARGTAVEQYGLRICRQVMENGTCKYALVLSDGAKTSGMVLCE